MLQIGNIRGARTRLMGRPAHAPGAVATGAQPTGPARTISTTAGLHQVMGVPASNAWEGKQPKHMPGAEKVPEGRGGPAQAGPSTQAKPAKALHKAERMRHAVGHGPKATPLSAADLPDAPHGYPDPSLQSFASLVDEEAQALARAVGQGSMAGQDVLAGRAVHAQLHTVPDITARDLAGVPPFNNPSFPDARAARRLKSLQRQAHKARMETTRMREAILGREGQGQPQGVRGISTTTSLASGGIASANAFGKEGQGVGTPGANPARAAGEELGPGMGDSGRVLEQWFAPGFGPGYTPPNMEAQRQAAEEALAGAAGRQAEDVPRSTMDQAVGQASSTYQHMKDETVPTASGKLAQAAHTVAETVEPLVSKVRSSEAVHRAEAAVEPVVHRAEEALHHLAEKAAPLMGKVQSTAARLGREVKEEWAHAEQLEASLQADPMRAVREASAKARDVGHKTAERLVEMAPGAAEGLASVATDAGKAAANLASKAGSMAAEVAGSALGKTETGRRVQQEAAPFVSAARVAATQAYRTARHSAVDEYGPSISSHLLQAVTALLALVQHVGQAANMAADVVWQGLKAGYHSISSVGAYHSGMPHHRAHPSQGGATSAGAMAGGLGAPSGDVGRVTDTAASPIYTSVGRMAPFPPEAGPDSIATFGRDDRPFVLGEQGQAMGYEGQYKEHGVLGKRHLAMPGTAEGWATAAVEEAEQDVLRGSGPTAGQHFPPSHSSSAGARSLSTQAGDQPKDQGQTSRAKGNSQTIRLDGGGSLVFSDMTGTGEPGSGRTPWEQQQESLQEPAVEADEERARQAGVAAHGQGQPLPQSVASVVSSIGEGGGGLQDDEARDGGVVPMGENQEGQVAPTAVPPSQANSTGKSSVHLRTGSRSFSTLADRLYGPFLSLARPMTTSTARAFENQVLGQAAKAGSPGGLSSGEFQVMQAVEGAHPSSGPNLTRGAVRDTGKMWWVDPVTGRGRWKLRHHWYMTKSRPGAVCETPYLGSVAFLFNDPSLFNSKAQARAQAYSRMAWAAHNVTLAMDKRAQAGQEATAKDSAQTGPTSDRQATVPYAYDPSPAVPGRADEDLAASVLSSAVPLDASSVAQAMESVPPGAEWDVRGMPRPLGQDTGKGKGKGTSGQPRRGFATAGGSGRLPSTGPGESNPSLTDQPYPAGIEASEDGEGPGRVKYTATAAMEVDSTMGWGEGDHNATRLVTTGGVPSSAVSDELEYWPEEAGSNSDSDDAQHLTRRRADVVHAPTLAGMSLTRARRLGPPQAQGFDDLTSSDLRELAYGSLASRFTTVSPDEVEGTVTKPKSKAADPSWTGEGPRAGLCDPEHLENDQSLEGMGLPDTVQKAREKKTDAEKDEADARGASFSG